VLEDTTYRVAAGDIGAEVARMPSPEQVADTLRGRYRR